MSRIFVVAGVTVLLCACAQSSGVLKLGPDTYSLSASAPPGRGGEPVARSIALTEANAYCTNQGKEIIVKDIGSRVRQDGGHIDLTFRCLAKGDPELQRPSYEAPPTAVIQDRRPSSQSGSAVSTPVPSTAEDQLQRVINSIPELLNWQYNDQRRFEIAANIDKSLQNDPSYASYTLRERFLEAVRRTKLIAP